MLNKEKLILGLNSIGSLGDCLYLTAAISQFENVTVQMHDSPQCRRVSLIYKNLADVEFVDNPDIAIYKKATGNNVHAAQRALDYLNITSINCIPRIILDEEEIKWAKEFLKNINNPVVVVNDNGGSSTEGNYCAQYRRPPTEVIQSVVNKLIKNEYSPIQFGIKDLKDRDNAFTSLNNVIEIRGLDVRQMAACYYLIGKYIGGDTGDYHLMLSVGGKCITFIPPENASLGYIYSDLLYTEDLWKNEKIRVKYINYVEPKKAEEYLNFDF